MFSMVWFMLNFDRQKRVKREYIPDRNQIFRDFWYSYVMLFRYYRESSIICYWDKKCDLIFSKDNKRLWSELSSWSQQKVKKPTWKAGRLYTWSFWRRDKPVPSMAVSSAYIPSVRCLAISRNSFSIILINSIFKPQFVVSDISKYQVKWTWKISSKVNSP